MQKVIFLDTNKIVGDRLSKYRKKAKLSQFQLAEATGLSRKFISDVENYKVDLGIYDSFIIADVLGIHSEDLTGNIEFDDFKITGESEVKYVKGTSKKRQ